MTHRKISQISDWLRKMAFAETERKFEKISTSVTTYLENLPYGNGTDLMELRRFANDRSTYAKYKLREIRGNRGLISSTTSEQNHSSVLVHLNNGEKHGNK